MKRLVWYLPLVALCGCGLFGKNAAAPTDFERRFFDVTTNLVARVSSLTNVVTVFQTNQQVAVVTVTNAVNQIEVKQVTNVVVVPVLQTNTVTVTNLAEQYQLKPGAGAGTVTAIGGAVAAPFGFGGIVTTVLGGFFAGYLGLRNKALKGDVTLGGQAAEVLTQQVETLLEVLKSTPQGQSIQPVIKAWLMKHQQAEGVLENVATAVAQVDNSAAQQAAQEILKALNQIKSGV